MSASRWIVSAFVGVSLLLGACAPLEGPASSSADAQRRQPKRITAAMMSDPPSISSQLVGAGSGTLQGGDALEDLVNAGLSATDNRGVLVPQLAEAVPTVDNGLWRLLPDGRMETTWKIREGAQWHDGTPFTVDDLVFTIMLGRDADLPFFRERGSAFIEATEQLDTRTITVRWTQPYIQADRLFSRRFGLPRPRHVLGPPYAESKESIPQLTYWTEQYVGTGPFKVRQWVAGSHLILAANERYPLGRPQLDEIEIRFIPDSTTLAANILAGEVHLTLGRNLSLSQAVQIRDHWKDGTVRIGIKNWIAVWPQLLNPNPAVLLDLQFRKALLHSIDRQQLVETLQYGMVPVAHTFVSPTEPVYSTLEPHIVRYDYDPRRTAQLLEGLGYSRGPDGTFRNAAGQPLALEVRTDGGGGDDAQETAALAVNDAFKRVGIASEPLILTQLQRQDRELNSTYPGVRVWRLPNDLWSLDRHHSTAAPLPQNRFGGGNRSRYMNPAFDALIEHYMSTIRAEDRVSLLGEIVRHMTEQLPVMGLWYNTEPILIANRLANVTSRDVGETTEAWNAHAWDLRS